MKTKLFSVILAFLTIVAWNVPMAKAEVDITEMVSILPSGLDFNKKAGVTTYTFRLKNMSREPLAGPFRVVIEDMDNDSVSILNPDGMTPEGKPFILYNQLELGARSKTESKKWLFQHQCNRIVLVTFKERWFLKLFPQRACSWFVTVYVSVISDSGSNNTPIANAGPDQSVFVGDSVFLDGSGSADVDGDLLTFDWSLTSVPEGSGAALSDSSAVAPTFEADRSGSYVAQLIVSDGVADSVPDTVIVSTANSRRWPMPDRTRPSSLGIR